MQGEDDLKKVNKPRASSCVVDHGNMFSEGLDDFCCRDISCNCLKNVKTEAKDSASLAKDSQIKGEKQLEDLKKSVVFLKQKFDDYGEDRKRKDENIKLLRGEVMSPHTKLETVQIMVDKQEQ